MNPGKRNRSIIKLFCYMDDFQIIWVQCIAFQILPDFKRFVIVQDVQRSNFFNSGI